MSAESAAEFDSLVANFTENDERACADTLLVPCLWTDLHPQPCGQRLVGGGDHSAFSGGHVLDGVETKSGHIPDGADGAFTVPGAYGMRSVFDQTGSLSERYVVPKPWT